MSKASYIVTVDDHHRDKLDVVANRLRDAGMAVRNQLHAAGAITGEIESDEAGQLASIPGVAHVSPSRELRAS